MMLETLKRNKALVFVFFICFAYWTYLFFFSSMAIVYDAVGYESLGKLIYEKGWVEFFRTGPNREPLYPLSIAMSLRLADILGVSYQKIQTVFQILLLFIVQILAFKIMTMCSFGKKTKLLAVLYLGFSPAIVNAGFSLFSEILAMPFVLLVVIFAVKFWNEAQAEKNAKIILTSVYLSLAFVGAIGVKAVFQHVFLLFMIIFLVGAIRASLQNKKGVMKKIVLGICIMVSLVGGSVTAYKYMNKIYNGKFDFTNRYDFLLFGTAYKRILPLSRDVWLAHFASIPGNNFCESVVNKEACLYPQFHGGDALWPEVLPPLLEGVPEKETASRTVELSFEAIMKNPTQYLFLTFLESLKMGFWESTQIGFVNYPKGLSELFTSKFFKNTIRLGVALLTYLGLFVALMDLFNSRRKLAEFSFTINPMSVLFFIMCVIFVFTGLYSIFAILSRFALPIAPLYVISIAYFFEKALRLKLAWKNKEVMK